MDHPFLVLVCLLSLVTADQELPFNGTDYRLFGGSVGSVQVPGNGTILFSGELSLPNSTIPLVTTLKLPDSLRDTYTVQGTPLLGTPDNEATEDIKEVVEKFGVNSSVSIQRLEITWTETELRSGEVGSGSSSVGSGSTGAVESQSVQLTVDMVTVEQQNVSLMLLHLASFTGMDTYNQVSLSSDLPSSPEVVLNKGFSSGSNVDEDTHPGLWVLKTDSLQGMKQSVICTIEDQPHAEVASYNMTHANHTCSEGFSSIKNITTTCNAGTWKLDQSRFTNLMTCYEITCPEVELDARGAQVVRIFPAADARPIGAQGGVSDFFCSENFIPSFRSGTCLDNRTWSWDPVMETPIKGPKCNLDTTIQCELPPTIGNTTIASAPPYFLLSTAYYYCNAGYVPEGTNTTVLTGQCDELGVWQVQPFRCVKIPDRCPNPPTFSGLFKDRWELPIVLCLAIGAAVALLVIGIWPRIRRRRVTPRTQLKVKERQQHCKNTSVVPSINISIRGMERTRAETNVSLRLNRCNEYYEEF